MQNTSDELLRKFKEQVNNTGFRAIQEAWGPNTQGSKEEKKIHVVAAQQTSIYLCAEKCRSSLEIRI